jgi:polyadenylation factor subunit 2
MPSKNAMLPGLPGLNAPMPAPFPDGTSTGGAQPMSMPGLPPFLMGANGAPQPPPIDLAKLLEMTGGQLPPPPGLPPGMPPLSQLPPGFQPPPGFPPLPTGIPGFGNAPTPPTNGAAGGGIRKRAPLPSQQESLQEEMRQGRYTKAR